MASVIPVSPTASAPTRKIDKSSARKHVFSTEGFHSFPNVSLAESIKVNQRNRSEGVAFLKRLPEAQFPVAFFDPQYRGVLDRLKFGNEGRSKTKERSRLQQMSETKIRDFIMELDRILAPSGHLFLWLDKFHFCSGFQNWFDTSSLSVVDFLTWDKCRFGLGYRTRRQCEHLAILQKPPSRAKGIWKNRSIPDVWQEKVSRGAGGHIHRKPVELQQTLIEAVSDEGDFIVDPAAGSFSVLDACQRAGRNFVGCDIEG